MSGSNSELSLDDTVKKTADLLSRVIKKPPLTAKLLSKPPFRYLHDIFTEVITTTGFASGLYNSDEMVSDNCKVYSLNRLVKENTHGYALYISTIGQGF
jgi:hypothetical protein